VLLLGTIACSCSRDDTSEPALPEAAPEQNSVVVYAAYDDKTYLPALFNRFTQATGIVVIVRNGEVPGIIDDVILNRATPPADVLITPSVGGVWRVAEESELRPNYSPVVADLPEWLQDPDQYWAALSYRTAVVAFNPAQVEATELGTYEALADASFRRKLCLASSTLAINRAVISMLIEKLGKREAELAVRGWVANLAQPPLESETQLLRALASGECAVGIVSSSSLAGTRLGVHSPAELYFDIEAIGITRHAHNPDAAASLVDWLLQPEIQAQHARQTATLPAAGNDAVLHSVAAVAAGLEEAVKLAERARYH
jgi:iron(III) transport system substrate-binding protein